MKKHFNWKGETTSMKYIENTKEAKMGISSMMAGENLKHNDNTNEKDGKQIILQNCQNIVINF